MVGKEVSVGVRVRVRVRVRLITKNFRRGLSNVTGQAFESLLTKVYFRKQLSKETFQCVMTFTLYRVTAEFKAFNW